MKQQKIICPKCKNELIQSINLKRDFFLYYKVYTLFCGSCDYQKVKKIIISKEDYLENETQ